MDLDLRFWHQNRRLSIQDRVELIMLRTELDEHERDLVDPDIILLFLPDELKARNTLAGQKVILDRIELAMGLESELGRNEHWAYDQFRHQRLMKMVVHERGMIAAQGAAGHE